MHDGHSHHHHDTEHTHQVNNGALLNYMLEHNKSHAAELHEIAESLNKDGNIQAAQLVESAVDDFNTGNTKLGEALKYMAGE